MPLALFVILFTAVLLVFAGIGVFLLVNPSRYMRRNPNPWMEDTPWTRIQLRAVGLVFCLFVLMVFSGSMSHDSQSNVFKGFADNMLAALWLAFACVWVGGILLWIAWRFIAVRIWVRKHLSSEELESAAWERRMTIAFSALLLLIVASALLMAAAGLYPPLLPGN
jgi:hypothetical protein